MISRAGMKQEAVTRCSSPTARPGLDVVRLKGGDPFVFGRGGEEALALAEAGVPFEIVPGVSSIAAVPASALIPVTHRGVSDRVTIASGHGSDGGEPDYAALAAPAARSSSSWGSSAWSSSAAGSWQRVCLHRPPPRSSRVARCPTRSRSRDAGRPGGARRGLESPALVIVGDVVSVGRPSRQRTEPRSSPSLVVHVTRGRPMRVAPTRRRPAS